MLDAAFRQIAGAVSSAVGGPYHAGTLKRIVAPIYDDGGSIVTPGTTEEIACRVQVDVATDAMRSDAGFMAEDVRLLILDPETLTREPALTISAGPFAGKTYSLMTVQRDPLGFAWECRGRVTSGGGDASPGS